MAWNLQSKFHNAIKTTGRTDKRIATTTTLHRRSQQILSVVWTGLKATKVFAALAFCFLLRVHSGKKTVEDITAEWQLGTETSSISRKKTKTTSTDLLCTAWRNVTDLAWTLPSYLSSLSWSWCSYRHWFSSCSLIVHFRSQVAVEFAT